MDEIGPPLTPMPYEEEAVFLLTGGRGIGNRHRKGQDQHNQKNFLVAERHLFTIHVVVSDVHDKG
jgi:hypothetical protein